MERDSRELDYVAFVRSSGFRLKNVDCIFEPVTCQKRNALSYPSTFTLKKFHGRIINELPT